MSAGFFVPAVQACAGCGRMAAPLGVSEWCRDCDRLRLVPLPQAGDAVRLDGEWWGAKPGARGVIDGHQYEPGLLMVVFGASAFRGPAVSHANPADDGPTYVSCSGGPCPAVPVEDLRLVGVTSQRFWRWADFPRKDGGVEYMLGVRLWAWQGKP